jgi:hypothetical protein
MAVLGTTIIDGTESDKDGESKTANELQAASGFPEVFMQLPWVYEEGMLPGLGAPVEMPEHLKGEIQLGDGEDDTPIRLPQTAFASIRAQATGNAILLQNLPQNAKVQVYNLQGKQIYLGNSGNSQILKILIQTKGIYVLKATYGSEKIALRVAVR